MARDWEATLRAWSRRSSDSEQDKQENAERQIRAAIAASSALKHRGIEVFAQGSYKNNTNVRQESDVDICVMHTDTFFPRYPTGVDRSTLGHSDATYRYQDFKADVGAALVGFFGSQAVTRGDKAWDISETTTRVEADVVAALEHRRYNNQRDYYGRLDYDSGTEFISDSGQHIINWPKQHYKNGVRKNDLTERRFKRMVRTLKRCRYEMEDKGVREAEGIPSYLVECLVWNVPDKYFGNTAYVDDMGGVLAHTIVKTRTDEGCSEWGEVNELKYLFRGVQPWTRKQANDFLLAAWSYMEMS